MPVIDWFLHPARGGSAQGFIEYHEGQQRVQRVHVNNGADVPVLVALESAAGRVEETIPPKSNASRNVPAGYGVRVGFEDDGSPFVAYEFSTSVSDAPG